MILFLEDWQRYPLAIIDSQTKNKSFLELAYKLKAMGIQNHFFFLALHNPALLGVDPHDPNLTLQQKAAISIECTQNFWYIVRNVLRVPATSAGDSMPVDLNRANLSLWWLFFCHCIQILTMPRQIGKSFSVNALFCALLGFICRNTKINLLTKDDGLRTKNMHDIKDIYAELPAYLNMRNRMDVSSTEAFEVGKLSNRLDGRLPSSSPSGANKVGRGLTSSIIGIDELPFQPHASIAYPALTAATGSAVENAKKNDEPYGIILTNTAGKIDEPSGHYVYEFCSDAAPWTELFYDAKNQEDLERMVRSYSRKGVFRVYSVFNHRQVGKTDEWLLEMLERTNASAEDANRDYLNIWTSGNSNSPLSAEILKKIAKSVRPEDCTKNMGQGGYIVRWYIKESQIDTFLATNQCILALDTSDAGGKDGIGFVLIDSNTGAVVAATAIYLTNLIVFAQFIVDFMIKYPTVTLIPERRNSAITLIDHLLLLLPHAGIDPFTRIFNWVVNDPMEYKTLAEEVAKPMRRRSEDIYVKAKTLFGFATAGTGRTSRTELYSSVLQNSLSCCGDKLYDRQLVEQINGLIVRNGRVDHMVDGHDDMVVAYLLCQFLLVKAKNLITYGIDPTRVLVGSIEKVDINPSMFIQATEQNEIRENINRVYNELAKERDTLVIQRLEQKLKSLSSRLILEEGEVYSLDQLLEDLRQQKRRNRITG